MLTLEEYEKLNPRCEITHEGKRVLFATPTVFTKWLEPEAQNYALLNRNMVLNGLNAQVKAYCLALSDQGYSELHLSSQQVGGSCHSLGERVDFKHEPMTPRQAASPVSNFTF